MYAHMEKMPEKYSLEWYMLQKPPPKQVQETSSVKELSMALVAVIATVGGMFAYDIIFK